MASFKQDVSGPALAESSSVPGVYFASPTGKLLEDYQKKYGVEPDGEQDSLERLWEIGLWLFKNVLRGADGSEFEDMNTREAVKSMSFEQLSGLIAEFMQRLSGKKSMESGSA